MQQFVSVGFQVAEQPQGLQYLGGQVLRLFNHNQGFLSLSMGLKQVLIEGIGTNFGEGKAGATGQLDGQFVADTGQSVTDLQFAVKHIGHTHMGWQALEHGAG